VGVTENFKVSRLLLHGINNGPQKFYDIDPRAALFRIENELKPIVRPNTAKKVRDRLLASPATIRLACKGFPRTNTLAFFV
jgi:hypothetical protein